MLGRIRREAESLTINGSGIQGVQSVGMDYSSVVRPLSSLGIQGSNGPVYAPEGPQTASLNVNTLFSHKIPSASNILSENFFLNFTGDVPFSGQIKYGTKNFIFKRAYVNNYSVSCAIGEIPQISTNSTVFGELGTGDISFPSNVPSPQELAIPGYSSIEINLDEFTTNRVSSFDVSIDTPRIPIYALNGDEPTAVIAGNPVQVGVNFALEVDDYEIKNMGFVPNETSFRYVAITLKKNNSDTTLLTYSFDNMLLTSESFSAPVDSNAVVNFSLNSSIIT
tara:strand:- start:2689 stop:3528 length:840 start_codon:yes stop_codon:yes gene_type:complete